MADYSLKVFFILALVCSLELSSELTMAARPSRKLKSPRQPPSSPSPTHTSIIGQESKKLVVNTRLKEGCESNRTCVQKKTVNPGEGGVTGELERSEHSEKTRHMKGSRL